MCILESLCCTEETNTKSNYPPMRTKLKIISSVSKKQARHTKGSEAFLALAAHQGTILAICPVCFTLRLFNTRPLLSAGLGNPFCP